jgi:hypothetical protein
MLQPLYSRRRHNIYCPVVNGNPVGTHHTLTSYSRVSQPGAREHHGALLIKRSLTFESSGRNVIPVLADENKTTIMLIDEKG